jgi:hypothetical protein
MKEHEKTKDHINSHKRNEIEIMNIDILSEHIITLMKIIYSMAQNDILLNKFKNLTHLGRAIEALHLIPENHPITYENNICG